MMIKYDSICSSLLNYKSFTRRKFDVDGKSCHVFAADVAIQVSGHVDRPLAPGN